MLPIGENYTSHVIEDLLEDLTENKSHDWRKDLPEYRSHSRNPPENVCVNFPPYEELSPVAPVLPPSYEEVIRSGRSSHVEAEVNEKRATD